MEQAMEFTREVLESLGAPFPEDEIEFLPRASSGGMALGLPYIDARSVMRRLDAVVGPANWSFDFDLLSPDGKMVRGKLTVLGVTKCDAGEGANEDEVLKSAVSDALKRCAVHFGIGRYLYCLPKVWAPYDGQKRRFIESPRLDPAAVGRALAVCGVSAPAPRSERPARRETSHVEPEMNGAGTNGARKSIWSAGGHEGKNGAAPESSGDRMASRPAPQPAPAPPAAEKPAVTPAPAGAMVCSQSGCGKTLTRGQHDVSVRAFGRPLCPTCQKQAARTEAR